MGEGRGKGSMTRGIGPTVGRCVVAQRVNRTYDQEVASSTRGRRGRRCNDTGHVVYTVVR